MIHLFIAKLSSVYFANSYEKWKVKNEDPKKFKNVVFVFKFCYNIILIIFFFFLIFSIFCIYLLLQLLFNFLLVILRIKFIINLSAVLWILQYRLFTMLNLFKIFFYLWSFIFLITVPFILRIPIIIFVLGVALKIFVCSFRWHNFLIVVFFLIEHFVSPLFSWHFYLNSSWLLSIFWGIFFILLISCRLLNRVFRS